ncbi:DUF6445 family protein [Thalassotalea agarivorans]|uniref:Phytanoyl-CoA dioxygenase (PhyH) n=1 Tax=Thalassotalea agarivorans TaxID=349064 RepID=A0A1I0E0L8_THASX|nr:DUF6445 family protein [Thalassotalea agarivorans]SET38507.1 hypothetical protein SAMN05660429_01682 [Thalassotalea agarivorans]
MEAFVKVNPHIMPQIVHVGSEQTPVVIIDDFVEDTTKIKEYACTKAEFSVVENSYYPGVRAQLPKQYVIDMLQPIYKQLYRLYQLPKHLRLRPQDIFFSLVATPQNELHPLQSIPHFDTPRPFYFALIHYLDDNEHGGTALFKHKETGFERISPERVEDYLSSASEEQQQHAASGYPRIDSPHYQAIHHIDYKPNRIVIYPGNILHSGVINPEKDVSHDPISGRLTANIFFEFN